MKISAFVRLKVSPHDCLVHSLLTIPGLNIQYALNAIAQEEFFEKRTGMEFAPRKERIQISTTTPG